MTRVLLAVAAFALVAAGCGAADDDPNLAAAAAKTEAAGSSRFEVTGEDASGQERTKIGCTGEADYAAKRVRLSCDYGSQGRMEVVSLGADTYMRGNVLGFLGVSDKWVRTTGDESLGEELSPQTLLAMLRDASQSTERLGEEEIRGVDTVGYRLVVECEQAELLDCDGQTSPVDVWIDGDGLVRRISVSEASTSPFTFEFYDFGAEVSIEAPAAADVVEVGQLAQPEPCRMADGSPLTGAQVSTALRGHGLDVSAVDECVGEAVAVFTIPAVGSNGNGFLLCTVSRTTATGSSFGLSGLKTAKVGNVHCAYSDDLAAPMRQVVAELERQIHP
jgi:hypothetical protein